MNISSSQNKNCAQSITNTAQTVGGENLIIRSTLPGIRPAPRDFLFKIYLTLQFI